MSSHSGAHKAPLDSFTPIVTCKAMVKLRKMKTKQKDQNMRKGPIGREMTKENRETVIRICYFKILLKKRFNNTKITLSSSIFKVGFHRKFSM